MIDYRPCNICQSYNHAYLSHYTLKIINNYSNKHITHHHYFLGGFCPRKTTQYTTSFLKLALIKIIDGITSVF